MRILVVSKFYPPVIGGVEVTVKELCEEFARHGHQVTAAVMTRGPAQDEMLNGVRVVRRPVDRLLRGGFNRALFRFMRDELSAGGYDMVHVHNFHILLSLQSAALCRLRGAPYVFSPHYHGKGHTALRDILFQMYKRVAVWGLGGAMGITCASEHERSKLLSDFPGLEGRCVVISPGIVRRELPRASRDPGTLLYVGRLMGYKGVDHVLRAMAELRSRGRPARLRVVGAGPDEARLRALSSSLGLEGSVDWLGEVDDDRLSQEYATAACLVLLSSAEAYGLVVAEALASGMPCVVARSAALTEFASEPGCIGVQRPQDAGEVADALLRAMAGGVQVGPFSQKISYWPAVAQRYLDYYERLLGRSP